MKKYRKELMYGIIEKIHSLKLYIGFVSNELDGLYMIDGRKTAMYRVIEFHRWLNVLKINFLYTILKIIA